MFKSTYTAQALIVCDGRVLVLHNTKKDWTDVGGKEAPGDNAVPLATLQREMAEEIFGNNHDRMRAFFDGLAEVPEPVRVAACKHPTWLWILEPDEPPAVDRSYDKAANDRDEWVELKALGKGRRKWNFRITSILRHLPCARPENTRPSVVPAEAGALKVRPVDGGTFLLTEKFNSERLQILIALKICTDVVQAQLKDYLKTAGCGRMRVRYQYGGIGRMNICQAAKAEAKDADPDVSGGYVQARMANLAKGAICSGIYIDVDIKNCHPSILEQLLVHHKLPSGAMRLFNTERDSVLAELMANTGHDKATVKELIYNIVYGGDPNTWCNKHGVDYTALPARFICMKDEMDASTGRLLDIYPEFREEAVRRKGMHYWNIEGSALSYLAQTAEQHCLLALMASLESSGVEVGSLISDGCHCKAKGDSHDVGVLPTGVLDKAECDMKANTGFTLSLTTKPFVVHPRIENAFIMEDTTDGGSHIAAKLLDVFVYDHVGDIDRRFFRRGLIWTHTSAASCPRIKGDILNMIMDTLDILQRGPSGLESQSRNIRPARDLMEYVFLHPAHRPGFADELWKSNLLKVCYSNGWFDCTRQAFFEWGAPDSPLTTIVIARPFPLEKFLALKACAGASPRTPAEHAVCAELKVLDAEITRPMFNTDGGGTGGAEQATAYYQYLCMAMSGKTANKQTAFGVGKRGCGKGVTVDLSIGAFGGYVKSTNMSNFILKKHDAEDSAKELSWLIPYEYRRIMYMNESKLREGLALDGNMIKAVSSGGDMIEARLNHKDETSFRLQAHLLGLTNALPDISPENAKEYALFFDFPSKFVPEAEVQERNAKRRRVLGNEVQDTVYHAKRDNMKLAQGGLDHLLDAWTLNILCVHWLDQESVPVPPSMQTAVDEFRQVEDTQEVFEALFHFTKDHSVTLTCKEVAQMVQNATFTTHVTRTEVTKWLKLAGCTKAHARGGDIWRGLSRAE